jgi:hypothetical protein
MHFAIAASLALGASALTFTGSAPSTGRASALEVTRAGPSDIVPDDLWAIHDLLLAGYTAPFMKEGPGKEEVRQSAQNLAKLLPQIHPHEPCRAQIGSALEGQAADRMRRGTAGWADNAALEELAERESRAGVVAAAQASWACLPGNFTEASFDNPFTEEAIDKWDAQFATRMPSVRQKLGACEGSKWPRTCSYWSSMHTMAHRADQLGLGGQLLGAVIPVLAAGATMCGGCTLHLRALHDTVLTEAVVAGLGQDF